MNEQIHEKIYDYPQLFSGFFMQFYIFQVSAEGEKSRNIVDSAGKLCNNETEKMGKSTLLNGILRLQKITESLSIFVLAFIYCWPRMCTHRSIIKP